MGVLFLLTGSEDWYLSGHQGRTFPTVGSSAPSSHSCISAEPSAAGLPSVQPSTYSPLLAAQSLSNPYFPLLLSPLFSLPPNSRLLLNVHNAFNMHYMPFLASFFYNNLKRLGFQGLGN